ncbi:hypothetical protein [Mycobacterium sp. Z3061]|uniref:hypothetical protein n=1 Tax=Mycobacterium sp. Z3061 TaxID=3073562 RepID=UPI002873BAF3|nr:hypothetical protein [Mycobacterium sp. Z3061]
MSDFTSELAFARTATDPEIYIERIKLAVRNEFGRIDDAAQLEDTLYFNHSAVPDFVIRWPDRSERRLYLRNSYESIVAGNDAVRFNDSQPVLLALHSSEEKPAPTAEISQQSQAAPQTLIAGPDAFDMMTDTVTQGETSESPVATLVRTNLPRGGRGLLTPALVEELLNIGTPASPKDKAPISERLSENFLPEAAARIARTANLVEIAFGEDFSALPEPSTASLSQDEVQTLLPWLLTRPDTTRDPRFWQYIGSMLDLTDVIAYRDALANVDLTPLISSNLRKWSGKRAFIGLENIPPENATAAETAIRADGVWGLLGSTLGINSGGRRLHLAPSGYEIRGRGGMSGVLWDDLAGTLGEYDVVSANLRGVSRSIIIHAEQSADVSADVATFASSVDDTYYVRNVTLALPSANEDAALTEVAVNFDTSIVASERPVSLMTLTRIALGVLAYQDQQHTWAIPGLPEIDDTKTIESSDANPPE